MFGVVPKTLWSKLITPDDENRIEMALRSLLIIDDKHKILVDTGAGDKLSEKQKKIYKIDNSKYDLASSLKKHNLEAKDITHVLLTHLHFDHTGGSTYMTEEEKFVPASPKPAFPNAIYYVQKTQYEWALEPSDRDKSGFQEDDFVPMAKEGMLRLVEGQTVILPDIDIIVSDGHTVGQQLIKISDKENTLVYCGDLIPTAAHIPLPYIPGYDNSPLKTIEEKKLLLSRACFNNWTLFFEHDPITEAVKVEKTEKGYAVKEKVFL